MYTASPDFIAQLNDMSFWYPILEQLSRSSKMPNISPTKDADGKLKLVETKKDYVLRIPETMLFYAPHTIGRIVDGEKVEAFDKLAADVGRTHEAFGSESFLRTGQTSNKHEWEDTCYLTSTSDIRDHLGALIDFSMMVGLPYTTFAVRRMIPTSTITVAFKNMPIAREIRMFAREGKVICAHPYWPKEAFRGGMYTDKGVTDKHIEELSIMPDMTDLNTLAEYVSRHFAHAWSMDFLQDTSGDWWLTDMALAASSYHWPTCEHKGSFNG